MSHKQSKLQRQIQRELAKLSATIRPPSENRQEGRTKRFLKTFWKAIVFCLTVLGAVGVIGLWPRASMYFDATLNPSKPFATPFILKNDSYETFRQVRFSCGVNRFETATGRRVVPITNGVGLTAPDLLLDEFLSPDTTTEIFCPIADLFQISEPAIKIDLDIYVSFTVLSLPTRFTRCFRFVTYQDHEGNLRWLEKGFGKSCEWPMAFLENITPHPNSN
jgi:hypothetical protein